jgi:7-keto-8-aminopelargonate synthetase-like enzyme
MEAVMATKIERREDVNSKEGLREYGDVEFADPVNHKYPIDTAEHVRAAWSYINHEDNAAKYDAAEVKTIKERIKRAAKKHGVEIEAD